MAIHVKVTLDDIERGCPPRKHPINPYRCPIALALERVTEVSWEVGESIATRLCDGERFDLPFIAKAFIRQFDDGLSVAPFVFDLTDD